MFTGAVPLEEFRREHTLEYDELVATGELEKHLVDVPSQSDDPGFQDPGYRADRFRVDAAGPGARRLRRQRGNRWVTVQ